MLFFLFAGLCGAAGWFVWCHVLFTSVTWSGVIYHSPGVAKVIFAAKREEEGREKQWIMVESRYPWWTCFCQLEQNGPCLVRKKKKVWWEKSNTICMMKMWPTYWDWKLVCRWKEAAFEQNAMVLSKAMPTLEKIDPCGQDRQQTALSFGLHCVSLGTTGQFFFKLNHSNWNNESMRYREKKPKKCYHFHERA